MPTKNSAVKNKVLNSINDHGESRCVDIFVRPDGTFGYETYRRDVEDNRGWFPDGVFRDQVFGSEKDALAEARSKVPWLNGVLTV